MLNKIKKAFTNVEETAEIIELLKQEKEEIISLKNSISAVENELKEKILEIENSNKKLFELGKENLEKVSKSIDDFQKEINEFKLIKTKLKSEIIEQVSADIKKELNIYIMNVKEKINELNNASSDIRKIASSVEKITNAIENLECISKSIKKEDFELSRYANILEHNDKEKLELMKKIDALERLISKMRKSSQTQNNFKQRF